MRGDVAGHCTSKTALWLAIGGLAIYEAGLGALGTLLVVWFSENGNASFEEVLQVWRAESAEPKSMASMGKCRRQHRESYVIHIQMGMAPPTRAKLFPSSGVWAVSGVTVCNECELEYRWIAELRFVDVLFEHMLHLQDALLQLVLQPGQGSIYVHT